MVGFEELAEADAIELRSLVAEHAERTDSPVAADVLARWEQLLAAKAFVKVMPHDYKRVLRERAEEELLAVGTGGEPAVSGESERPLDAVGEAGA
jgi:glutamate synthase domain-containing protein 3